MIVKFTNLQRFSSRLPQVQWMLLSALLVTVGAFLIFVLVREDNRVHGTERDRLEVLKNVVADNLQDSLESTNRALEGVIKDHLSSATPSPTFDVSRRLRVLADTMKGIRIAMVLNSQGIITASNRPELIGWDFSQREYFKTVQGKPDKTTLYLSAPFVSLQNDLVVAVARMVPGTHGEFAGSVVATLDPEYFINLFRPILYAPDVWAFVDHSNGVKLMDFPERPDINGVNGINVNQPGSIFNRHLQSGHIDSILVDTMHVTGEQRLVTLKTIQPGTLAMDSALVIGVSRELTAIAQPLRRQTLIYGLLYLVLCVSACSVLYWSQKRRGQIEALDSERERERSDAHERMQLAQRMASFGNWTWDIATHTHTWSDEIFRIYGRDLALAPAEYPEVEQYFTPQSWAVLSAAVETALASGTPYAVDAEVVRSDGDCRWITVRGNVSCDADGKVVFLQGTVQDITEKKRLDLELEEHRHHLEDLVQSRTLALGAARDAAEAANRSKAEFLANMSHEIRSPLNAILGLAYLMEQAHLDHDTLDMVHKIRASGRSLLSISNDILDVSKIEAGHMVMEQAPFRLADVIDSLAASMGLAVGNKNIELVIQPLPAGIVMVRGDALRLGQVLTNLTSNAIKFTTAGRVELHTDLLSHNDEEIVLRFSVQDTGIGIAPALQDEVFSAFTQADSSTTRRFGGTGLGLTISRQLVHLMGGEIGLTSTLGQGSEFWFTVPLQHIVSVDFSSPDMVRVEALIADDSDVALQAVSSIAKGLGWEVQALTSGDAVLEQVLQRKGVKLPHVVVLDWKMPGLDGLATARAIRDSLPPDQCPIVIMSTAFSLTTLASQPGAELVDAILHKPVTSSALYNAVLEARHRRTVHVDLPRTLLQISNDGLAGVRVLVVDDSDINREVAQRILREQGAIVSLADDGQQALDWLVSHPLDVDLVLMDVQMPVMDGIEATRQLRRMPQFNELPIVALTAGAFKSQQDAAQAAGMSEFISKPFDVPHMIALIQRLRRRSGISNVLVHPTRSDIPADETEYKTSSDGQMIDISQGLQIWKDMPSYRAYLRRFVVGYGRAVDVMNASLAVNDVLGAAALAHKLSGVAANLALPDAHRLAGEAERVLSNGYDATEALARLGNCLVRTVAAIAQFVAPADQTDHSVLAESPRGNAAPLSPPTLKALLVDLLVALNTDNPDPAVILLASLASQVTPLELTRVRDRVQSFDFRGAEAATRTLASAYGISFEE